MKTKNSDSYLYFKNHESEQNSVFLRTFFWCTIFTPIVLLGGLLKLIPFYGFTYLIILNAILICSIIFSYFTIKFDPFSPAIKYILVITVEALFFILTINQRTEIFMAYSLVPLISCLYLDKRYTSSISVICYLIMILSLLIRAMTKANFIENNYTRLQWFTRYATGMTIEYAINIIAITFISNNNYKVIETDRELTMKQFTNQTLIISSFMELLNKNSGLNPYHPKRCSQYATVICRLLRKRKDFAKQIDETDIPYFSMAVLVHDIGLLILPAEIITKKTPLNELEIQEIQLHTIQGEEIFRQNMSNLDKKFLDMCSSIIMTHHEQWNGMGYPNQLSENSIPLFSRIVYAADTLEELTNSTLYNEKKYSFDDAIDEIRKMGGKEIDPLIAQVIYDSREELRLIYEKLNQFML